MKRYHDGLKIELIMGITPLHFRIKLFWSGRYSVLLGALGFCIFAQSTDVNAQDMNCIGTLGEIETGQIRVPRGRTCILRGTIVRGNVTVEQLAD